MSFLINAAHEGPHLCNAVRILGQELLMVSIGKHPAIVLVSGPEIG